MYTTDIYYVDLTTGERYGASSWWDDTAEVQHATLADAIETIEHEAPELDRQDGNLAAGVAAVYAIMRAGQRIVTLAYCDKASGDAAGVAADLYLLES